MDPQPSSPNSEHNAKPYDRTLGQFDPMSWDGLPNGDFVLDITPEQAKL